MADDFLDHIAPIAGSSPIDRLEGGTGAEPGFRRAQSITGRVMAVHRRAPHQRGEHTLDITVGGDAYTEIVLRVPQGAYANIEGKRAILYIDE